MNIILIGFMGAGKSSIAKKISEKTGDVLIEMDDMIVERSGRKNVAEIFDKDGELRFREMEIEVAKEISTKDNVVVATGGGVIINKIILDYLRKNGKVVFLQTRFTEILARVGGVDGRPIFQDKKKAKILFDFREVLYKEYSDLSVATDNRSLDEVCESVLSMLKNKRR